MTASQLRGIEARRAREKDKRRAAILEAAAVVFASRGLDGATMDEVAAAAELSKGSLYLHFRSKSALFVALGSRIVTLAVEQFERAMADDSALGIDVVRSMATSYARVVEQNPQRFRIVVGSLASNPDVDVDAPAFVQHKERVARACRLLADAMARGQADGSVRADAEPLDLAFRLWSAMVGVLLNKVNHQEMQRKFPMSVDIDGFVPGAIALLCDGLRSGEAR